MGKIVLMINQKGGAGKSTALTFFANALHKRGKNILVVDCDPQRSLIDTRDDVSKEEASSSYGIKYWPLNSVGEELANIVDDYDFIFVDMPGSLDGDGMLKLWAVTDVFCFVGELPGHSIKSLHKAIQAFEKHKTNLIEKGFEFDPILIGVLNKVEHHEKEEAEDYLERAPQIWNFPWLNQYIPHLKVFKTLQTIEPYNHPSSNYRLGKVVDQFMDAIN